MNGFDPRQPHGVSLAFQHEPGAPCVVCDNDSSLRATVDRINAAPDPAPAMLAEARDATGLPPNIVRLAMDYLWEHGRENPEWALITNRHTEAVVSLIRAALAATPQADDVASVSTTGRDWEGRPTALLRGRCETCFQPCEFPGRERDGRWHHDDIARESHVIRSVRDALATAPPEPRWPSDAEVIEQLHRRHAPNTPWANCDWRWCRDASSEAEGEG